MQNYTVSENHADACVVQESDWERLSPEALASKAKELATLCRTHEASLAQLREEKSALLNVMTSAAEQIRVADYTMARSDLLVAIARQRGN